MAREGITFEQVAAVADALAGEGQQPTIRAVREKLGDTGSPNTIHKHLTAWREARPVAAAAAPELPQALTAAIAAEIERAASRARGEIEGRLVQAQAEAAELAAAGEVLEGERDELAEQVAAQKAQVEVRGAVAVITLNNPPVNGLGLSTRQGIADGMAKANADAAVNYGGIGAVIGHEISHHFDDQGAKYDEHGRLADWWTPSDVAAFEAAGQRLIAQYDAYEVLGEHVGGEFTLGENIGDLAGLAIAHDAYIKSLNGREAPVIDGTTGDQRFFMGWAQVWRRNYRDTNLLQRLTTDPHAPSIQRAWVVRNIDAWYSAFNVQPGTSLYLAPADRVRIW